MEFSQPRSTAKHASMHPGSLLQYVLHITCPESRLRYSYHREDGSLYVDGSEGGAGEELLRDILAAAANLFPSASSSSVSTTTGPDHQSASSGARQKAGRSARGVVGSMLVTGVASRADLVHPKGRTVVVKEQSPDQGPAASDKTEEGGGERTMTPATESLSFSSYSRDEWFTEAFSLPCSPVATAEQALPVSSETGSTLGRRSVALTRVTDNLFEAVVDESIFLEPVSAPVAYSRLSPLSPVDRSTAYACSPLLMESSCGDQLHRYLEAFSDDECDEEAVISSLRAHYDEDDSLTAPYCENESDGMTRVMSPFGVALSQPPVVVDLTFSPTPTSASPPLSLRGVIESDHHEEARRGIVDDARVSLDDDFWHSHHTSKEDTRDESLLSRHRLTGASGRGRDETVPRSAAGAPNPVLLSKALLTEEQTLCLGQVDRKYIIVVGAGGLLMAVDQHAAHERVQLERMTDRLLAQTMAASGSGSSVYSNAGRMVTVRCGVEIRLTAANSDILQNNRTGALVKAWGFDYHFVDPFPSAQDHLRTIRTVLTRVPEVEGEALTAGDFLEYLHLLAAPGSASLPAAALQPPAVLRVLASKSCRTAIKFGDELTESACQNLLVDLSGCKMPFQCAHGRPSIVPLVVLGASVVTAQHDVYAKKKPNFKNVIDHTRR
jgi:hypothetical protein